MKSGSYCLFVTELNYPHKFLLSQAVIIQTIIYMSQIILFVLVVIKDRWFYVKNNFFRFISLSHRETALNFFTKTKLFS